LGSRVRMKKIFVDDISSISESIFSFKYKGRIIKTEPLNLKFKLEENRGSSYHFNHDDLKKLSTINNKLKPFDSNEDLSKREYIYHMKQHFIILLIMVR
jgi:hypothetical protein